VDAGDRAVHGEIEVGADAVDGDREGEDGGREIGTLDVEGQVKGFGFADRADQRHGGIGGGPAGEGEQADADGLGERGDAGGNGAPSGAVGLPVALLKIGRDPDFCERGVVVCQPGGRGVKEGWDVGCGIGRSEAGNLGEERGLGDFLRGAEDILEQNASGMAAIDGGGSAELVERLLTAADAGLGIAGFHARGVIHEDEDYVR